MDRIVLHVDFDHFFAQCEEARRPELRSGPVVVCVFSDRGGDSGAVATANYAARKFGVKSGIPISHAKSRLHEVPDAVFLPADFAYYSGISQEAMDEMKGFADVFEYVGKDEAYMDVTRRTGGDYKKASYLAQQVKNAVRRKTRLTCSVGVTPNRLLSKIASDYKKPDGLTVVPPGKVAEFLEPLDIRDIPGIGGKTEKALAEMGIRTVGQMRSVDIFELQQRFGRRSGTHMHNAARGIDDEPVSEREPNVQHSRIVTLKRDSNEFGFLAETLGELCRDLHSAVVKRRQRFKSVGIQLVQSDLSQKTRSRMLRSPVSDLEVLEKSSVQLLREALRDQEKPVRRLGVRISELSEAGSQGVMDSYF
ncbi:nucleotidyltransferase/DNA polymerase involved in DNA repair [Cenarchaeum symbiosum A]|uniref:DNA polymerase IV n=1 Tax=Cenarchaeum symbiosum (strain A) TaxID=414004 RepID=A0RUK5_CENSY|nr:nucleotidyltransferase/DNA polymerase involved in DNA repair [Cenarchaeum symbiosum A]